jgi:imidazoleglycerol-phosphate dehydratase
MTVFIERNIKETKSSISLKQGLDSSSIKTEVGFLDYMLDLVAFHSHFLLNLIVDGYTDVDAHRTTEDVGIVLGLLLTELGKEKESIICYGTTNASMGETLARLVTDIRGRSYLYLNVDFSKGVIE